MALKRFTDNAQTPEKKRVAIPLTSSADNTDYYATGSDMAEIVLNNTSRLWDLKATVLPTCRSFRDPEYLKAGSWFFEDISNTEDKPDKLKEKNVQFARLLCEEGQSAQEGLKFVKQYLFYVNMTDNELELSMRGLLLNGGGEVQGATPWKTGVDEADVARNLQEGAKIGNSLVATTDETVSIAPKLKIAGISKNQFIKLNITPIEKISFQNFYIGTNGGESVILTKKAYSNERKEWHAIRQCKSEKGLLINFKYKDNTVYLEQIAYANLEIYSRGGISNITYEVVSEIPSDTTNLPIDDLGANIPQNTFTTNQSYMRAFEENDNLDNFKGSTYTGTWRTPNDKIANSIINKPFPDSSYDFYVIIMYSHGFTTQIGIEVYGTKQRLAMRRAVDGQGFIPWNIIGDKSRTATTLQAYNAGITKEI